MTETWKKALVTSIVGLLISGLAGAYLQRWLDRARPHIIITSVGFRGPDFGLVEVTEEAIEDSREDNWGPTLRKFETFQRIATREKDAADTELRLEAVRDLLGEWLSNPASAQSIEEHPTLSQAEIVEHPAISEQSMFLSAIVGSVRRRELTAPPMNLAALRKRDENGEIYPRLVILEERHDKGLFTLELAGWALHRGNVLTLFPLKGLEASDQKEMMETVAESFARGVRENILHYCSFFRNHAADDLLRVKELRASLQAILLENARLAVEVAVHNAGNTSLVLRPHAKLRLLHEKLRDKPFLLSATKPATDEDDPALARLLGMGELGLAGGTDYVVDEFLPSASAAPYAVVAPGGLTYLNFVGLDSLGTSANEVKSFYEHGLLTCEFTADSFDGRAIVSTVATFGQRMSDELRRSLLGQATK